VRPTDAAITRALNTGQQAKAGRLLAGETPTLDALFAQIRTLTPSRADRAAFARYLLVSQRLLQLQERLASDLEATDLHDATRVTALLQTASDRKAKVVAALGASRCRD
jgi:hypothetical protein